MVARLPSSMRTQSIPKSWNSFNIKHGWTLKSHVNACMYVTQLSGIGQCDYYWVCQCKYRNLQNIKKSSINILSIFKLMHISVVGHCLIFVMETFQKLVLSASSRKNRELLGLDKQKDLLFISRILSPDGKTKQVSKTLRFCCWNEIMTKSNECVSLMIHHHHRFLDYY